MADIQTATTGNLATAQNILLAQCRFTMEHNQPCAELIEHFKLGQGNKQLTIPKVGQMTANDLVDGHLVVVKEEVRGDEREERDGCVEDGCDSRVDGLLAP